LFDTLITARSIFINPPLGKCAADTPQDSEPRYLSSI